jgi:hypothetical protein
MARNAFICTAKGCVPPFRTFVLDGDAKPACPQHGTTNMTRQANVPYMEGEKKGEPKRVKPTRPAAKKKGGNAPAVKGG